MSDAVPAPRAESHARVPAPRLGRGRGLSRGRIAAAALHVIDEQGLGAASMRTIGARLGVNAMSLYKYFATRELILDAVVELIVSELDADPEVFATAENGWRDYLDRLARGVRRYALAHPHAFPLVTTRPAVAPWINPPLRSLVWVESMLAALHAEGFDDDQTLFAYRSFNSFLLGYLLMETGAMSRHDPRDGDGSFTPDTSDPAPVPGGLTPTRTDAQTDAIADARTSLDQIDPQADIDIDSYPMIHRLARGLAAERFTEEFLQALSDVLDRIEAQLSRP